MAWLLPVSDRSVDHRRRRRPTIRRSPSASPLSSIGSDRRPSRRTVARRYVTHAAADAFLEAANRSSVLSRHSVASAFSYRSAFSVLSAASFLSVASAASIGSSGSFLSIGSAGSILSVGSAGSILSFCSSGSVLGFFDAGHLPRGRARDDASPADAANVARLSGLLAVAAMVAAARPRVA